MKRVVSDLTESQRAYDLLAEEDKVLKTNVTRLEKELKAANDRVSNIEKDLNASKSELLQGERQLVATTTERDNLKKQLEAAGVALPKALNAPSDSWIGQNTLLRPVTLDTTERDRITVEAEAAVKAQKRPGTANAVKSFAGSVFTGLVGVGKLAMSDPGAKKVPPMELGLMSTKTSARGLVFTDAPPTPAKSVQLMPMSSAAGMMATDDSFDITSLVKQAQDVCMSVLVAEGQKCAKLPEAFIKSKKSMMITHNGNLVWVCRREDRDDMIPYIANALGGRVNDASRVGNMLMGQDNSDLNYEDVQYGNPQHADAEAAVRFLITDKTVQVKEVQELMARFGKDAKKDMKKKK
jgi:hypothetical protein